MAQESMSQPDIVIVEDDGDIGELLQGFLAADGFTVRWVRSGMELDRALSDAPADLLVLDLMLPGEDGLSICRRLRADPGPLAQLPILILTARRDEIDRVVGLEIGADDYLTKPFSPRELAARLRAILRRTAQASTMRPMTVNDGNVGFGECVRFGDCRLDVQARRLFHAGKEVEISTGDYDLLMAFVTHPNRVLSRDMLMDLTRGGSWEAFDRSIDVALSRLRRKIEPDPARPSLIKTVRNGGYMLVAPVRHGADP
jgi:two-component system, OmpR family, response regulator